MRRLPLHSPRGYSYGYFGQFGQGIDCFIVTIQNWNNCYPFVFETTNMGLHQYMHVQMTVHVHEQTFPLKKALASKIKRYMYWPHFLLIIFGISSRLFISSKRSDHNYLVKQNCVWLLKFGIRKVPGANA